MIAMDRLLTIKELATLTQLAEGSIYHMISEGRIPVVRISKRCVRFRYSEILQWWDRISERETERLG
jgi:excisionase family DNA binding protein